MEVVRPLVRLAARISLLAAGLLSGWVASAGAGLPPLPTVPSVQVPTLPVLPPAQPAPPVRAPVPPAAVPQLPVAAPKAPVAPPIVQQPSQPLSIAQGSGGQSSSAVAGTPSAAPRSREARPERVLRLRLSRDWIARIGPKRHRTTALVFSLRRPALVEFVVAQVFPECRRIGRFRVQGRAGRNRVLFRGRIGGKVLAPGTYLIQARAGRQRVVDTRLVVVSRREGGGIASARGANTCRSPSVATARPSSFGTAGPLPVKPDGGSAQRKMGSHPSEGVLGATFAREAVDVVKSIPPWVYALLGLAIVLLAVAALPLRAAPSPRTAVLLANRRELIALAGAAALTVATIFYALN